MTSVVATRWTRELQSIDLRELQASCMTLLKADSSSCAILAGKKAVTLVNTELLHLGEFVARAERQSKYDAACLASSPSLFALGSNDVVELWRPVPDGKLQIVTAFKAHSRTVMDLEFSAIQPTLLASASVDAHVFVWDTRVEVTSRRHKTPVMSFSSVTGASQVKWCPERENIIASAHEGDVRLWDTRNPSFPFQYIAAHPSKIHGLDWNPKNSSELATASQDQTCKIFDVSSPTSSKKPISVINCKVPVWRCKFCPSGGGVITTLVPIKWKGAGVKEESQVYSMILWGLLSGGTATPVHSFVGHSDIVLDFEWRSGGGEGEADGDSDEWIVSWSKDGSLRFWAMEKMHDFTELLMEKELQIASSRGPTVEEELSAVDLSTNKVLKIKKEEGRRCILEVDKKGRVKFELKLEFPEGYPFGVPPSFEMTGEKVGLGDGGEEEVLEILRRVARKLVARNQPCMDIVLRKLELLVARRAVKEREQGSRSPSSASEDLGHARKGGRPNVQDRSVPFPRTSGARFCGPGYLVCFGRPGVYSQQQLTDAKKATEKAIEKAKEEKVKEEEAAAKSQPVVKDFRSQKDRKGRKKSASVSGTSNIGRKHRSSREKSVRADSPELKKEDSVDKDRRVALKASGTVVHIFDASDLLPVSKKLAHFYKVDSTDPFTSCIHNGALCRVLGLPELSKTWSMAAQIAMVSEKIPVNPFDHPLSQLPFGRKLLETLIQYLAEKIGDVQTAAVLCCIFGDSAKRRLLRRRMLRGISGDSTKFVSSGEHESRPPDSVRGVYNTVHGVVGQYPGHPGARTCRSNSWSEDNRHPSLLVVAPSAEYSGQTLEPLLEQQQQQSTTQTDIEAKEVHEENERDDDYDPDEEELLDQQKASFYDGLKLAYANVLRSWNYLDARASVLKTLKMAKDGEDEEKMEAEERKKREELWNAKCFHCQQGSWVKNCLGCQRLGVTCSICQIGVRGSAMFCLVCGHGGHTLHVSEWFHTYSYCPAGCGCSCAEEMQKLL